MMTTTSEQTALARNGETSRGITLAQVREMTGYDVAQIAMIRHNMATSTGKRPEDVPFYDLALFCHASKALGLDPLLRQAYWISREGKGTLQVGIDGFRAIADRSGTYAGAEQPVFRGISEITVDGKKLKVPDMASVVVWKIVAGQKCAFTGEARWAEFYPGDKQGFMWRKMPFHMLGKCAEGQALRRAFPAQLGAVQLSAEAGEEPMHVMEIVQEESPDDRRDRMAAAYDRTIGQHSETGPASPVQDVRPPAGEPPTPAVPAEPGDDQPVMITRQRDPLNIELGNLIKQLVELGKDVEPFSTPLPAPRSILLAKIQAAQEAILREEDRQQAASDAQRGMEL